ncbi:MAG: Dam family site-specific DNA-(adenine-N6)-methyltransferase [Nitrososphaeraceae archaeon]|nr:Dam family site-specific DNA-(adenine-N6)-methyltransferase [Nitrososphaeraceae archaeon]
MKPFIKWAGGKTRILDQLRIFYPDFTEVHSYYELFLGGGAVGLSLLPHSPIEKFTFNDLNRELILTFRAIKSDVMGLIRKLDGLTVLFNASDEEGRINYYYKIRDLYNKQFKPEYFIFLNKLCYNGLYRVNSKGEFNVPLNKRKKIPMSLYNRKELIEVAAWLNRCQVNLTAKDFTEFNLGPSDFVYLDPPYEGTFKGYTPDPSPILLKTKKFVESVDKNGGKFMLSNSHTIQVLEIFKDYNIHKIYAPRTISRDVNKRGSVKEVVITNY